MRVESLKLEGLKLIHLDVREDERGFFVERFHAARFREAGLPWEFAQDNFSWSKPGVLRGLHLQEGQGKLVGVVAGRIWDVAVDLREDSPTYRQWHGLELAAGDGKLFWIPAGFAHGFCVLGSEPAGVLYKVDRAYDASAERGVRWDEPSLAGGGVRWPIERPTLSARDRGL